MRPLAGGVAANLALRERISQKLGQEAVYLPLSLCTDNAAMIAAAGYHRLRLGQRSGLDLDVTPNLPLAAG